MIPVTKPYIPNRSTLDAYIDGVYERASFSNNGILLQELTQRLKDYLNVENLLLVSNGTLALQVAYMALGVSHYHHSHKPEAITSPFSYIATASSLKWEGVNPIFSDIDPETWCISPKLIESKITNNTQAIVPVHVFGNACEVDAINAISQKHNLKVIYDASHAFAINYDGQSILNHGDACTLSFHATKLFHTGEGGAIVFKKKKDFDKAKEIVNFGIESSGSISQLGINAKMSELHAAIGLSVLDEFHHNLNERKHIWKRYEEKLQSKFQLQKLNTKIMHNASYFPIVFNSEVALVEALELLEEKKVFARRYFYPSLDRLNFLSTRPLNEVSADLSKKILCLPIYCGLSEKDQNKIIELLLNKKINP